MQRTKCSFQYNLLRKISNKNYLRTAFGMKCEEHINHQHQVRKAILWFSCIHMSSQGTFVNSIINVPFEEENHPGPSPWNCCMQPDRHPLFSRLLVLGHHESSCDLSTSPSSFIYLSFLVNFLQEKIWKVLVAWRACSWANLLLFLNH